MVSPRIRPRTHSHNNSALRSSSKVTRASVGSEYATQVAVIRWARENERRFPKLHWLHSSLNGAHMHPAVAHKMKLAGMARGVWDLFLPVARPRTSISQWHGLYIEMKHGRNKLTLEQKEFGDFVSIQGYQVVEAHSFEQATWAIKEYLS